jgi:hypothetical protein
VAGLQIVFSLRVFKIRFARATRFAKLPRLLSLVVKRRRRVVNSEFRQFVESLEPKFKVLMAMAPVRYVCLPRGMPERGIYLFSEGDRHLYVGRTNRIRQRLAGHCRPSSNHFRATFSFRIAREATGLHSASYSPIGSRANLVKDLTFGPAFVRAKARLADMDLRFVEEADPVRQTLLEVYVAVTLKTPCNDFDNH